MNNRRKLIIVLGAASWPLVSAQQPRSLYRIGYLTAAKTLGLVLHAIDIKGLEDIGNAFARSARRIC